MPDATELNPFNFSRPAPADELINREQELTELLRLAEANSNSRLTAPRRYGKTTLLKRVREEAEKLGMNTVYVNFYGLLSVEEAANRIEDAYRRSLHGAVRNFVVGLIRTFRPKATIPKTGISVEPTLDTDVGRRLVWLLDLPVKIMEKTGNPTLSSLTSSRTFSRPSHPWTASSAVAWSSMRSRPAMSLPARTSG